MTIEQCRFEVLIQSSGAKSVDLPEIGLIGLQIIVSSSSKFVISRWVVMHDRHYFNYLDP